MRRLLIITLALLVIAALAAPAAIGWLLHERVQPALEQRFPGAGVDWQKGWWQSRIELDSPALTGRAGIRHLPLSPPGWLALDARLTPAAGSELRTAAVQVDGHLGITGTLTLRAASDVLELAGPVVWQYRGPRIELTARRDGVLRADALADWLLIHDRLGNQLAFTDGALEIDWTPGSGQTADLALSLTLQRDGEAPSRLTLKAASVDRDAFGQLLEFASQLGRAEPGSASAGMAALGLAGAWQQLRQGGLTVQLEALSVDGQGELTGRWQADRGAAAPDLSGALPLKPTLDWTAQILGLATALSPGAARTAARDLLDSLIAEGRLRVEDQRIVVVPTAD